MCIFCKIVSNEIPSYKIYEDDQFLAFLDISQATKGHTLVIPKKHYNSMEDIDPILAGELFTLTVKLANHISNCLNVKNYNVLNNKGKLAGQTIEHFHLHIIPRYITNDFLIEFKENKLTDQDFKNLQTLLKQ